MSGDSPELDLVADFLAECLPFDSLGESTLRRCAASIAVRYCRVGHCFSVDDGAGLFIIRSGAVDEHKTDGIFQRLESGESFFIGADDGELNDRFIATEDTLIYRFPEQAFLQLRRDFRHIDRFFHTRAARQLRRAARYRPQAGFLMQSVASAMSKKPVCVSPEQSIRGAAQMMTEHRVSSVIVLDGDHLLGIVTDRDLRSRVIAGELSPALPIREVMSPDPLTIGEQNSLFDAVLLMTDRRVHHVPVVNDEARLTGMLSTSDIHLAREDDPLFFVQRIKRLNTVAELQEQMQRLPDMFRQWVLAETPSNQITRLTTAVSDALTQRLITLALEELGAAPQPFCWLGFGSQARGEQLLGGDQDNGLLIADGASDSDMAWFESLAKWVCDGLNACGYDYCPGDVMASNPAWRQRLQAWRKTVDNWMHNPSPNAVMRVSIAFDLRPIYGDRDLCEQLQTHMLQCSSKNTIFLAALAENVLSNTPPLGLFGRIAVERSGEHSHELDMKKRGVLPIVEVVRLHALAHSITEVNTYKRLQALAETGAMTLLDSRNLEDAYTLINDTRLHQQAEQLAQSRAPDNYLSPQALSRLQRHNLKQAFRVVHQAQDTIRLRYRAGV